MSKIKAEKGVAFKEMAKRIGTLETSMLAVAVNPPKNPSRKLKQKESIRQIYLENKKKDIALFEASLEKVKLSGLDDIVEMNNKQLAAATQVFDTILDQEEYIHSKSPYVDAEEEKQLLEKFVQQAKEIFGAKYEVCLNHFKNW